MAGSELLRAERDGKTLELTFYAPSRAIVRLHLESEPSKVELDENIRMDTDWNQETGELEVHLLRGAAPDYWRILRVHLRYTPHVMEKLDPAKSGHRGPDFTVFNAIRFPLSTDVTIPSSPPLIVADPNSGGHMVISSSNRSDDVLFSDFTLDGAFRGAGSARMFGKEELFTRVRFQPSRSPAPSDVSSAPASDGLVRGNLTIRSGHEHGTSPMLYMTAAEGANSHYQYDFDRDGAPEWVLESSRLRLIVSPADSGRALAFVDKSTNDDLITLGGALHDFLVPAGAALQQASGAGDFSFNRAYHAEWIEGKEDTGLRLSFQENEHSTAGLHVEKILRLAAPETVEAAYRVWVVTPPSTVPVGNSEAKRSFVSMLTVPIAATEEGNTRFCWDASPPPASEGTPSTAKAVSDPHCEDVLPESAPISIPDSISRLEISHPGRFPLVVEWTLGRAVVVPKAFSAQVNFVVPLPPSSDAPGEFTLRYTVGGSP